MAAAAFASGDLLVEKIDLRGCLGRKLAFRRELLRGFARLPLAPDAAFSALDRRAARAAVWVLRRIERGGQRSERGLASPFAFFSSASSDGPVPRSAG